MSHEDDPGRPDRWTTRDIHQTVWNYCYVDAEGRAPYLNDEAVVRMLGDYVQRPDAQSDVVRRAALAMNAHILYTMK